MFFVSCLFSFTFYQSFRICFPLPLLRSMFVVSHNRLFAVQKKTIVLCMKECYNQKIQKMS